MSSYADLGNGNGLLYGVHGGVITILAENNPAGSQMMKELALASRAIAVNQRGYCVITITSITGSGNVTQFNIDAINQIGSSVAYTSGNEEALAVALAAEINSHTPGSGVNYLAKAFGTSVYVFAPEGSPTTINGDVTAISDTGNITISATDISGATDQTEVYDTNTGFRFYIDSDLAASATSISGATEITKYIVPRTLDSSIPGQDVTLSSGLATIDRTSSMVYVKLSCESGNTDDCIGINPVGFANGDIVYVSGVDANNEITFTEDANGNIFLRNSENYVSTGTGTWLKLRYEDGSFYEVHRGFPATSFTELTRAQALAQMAAGTITAGKFYKITDIGHRGVILQGISTTELSIDGIHIAAVPDWQDSTSNFEEVWVSLADGGSYAINKLVVWGPGTMYVNTTGNNTNTAPSSDGTNWTLVDRATDDRYVVEPHKVVYDITNNLFREVKDPRGNTISEILNTYPDWFVFGCDEVTNNTFIAKGASDGWVNSTSEMMYNGDGSEFKNNTVIDSSINLALLSGAGRQFNNNFLVNTNLRGKVGSGIQMFYFNENVLNGAFLELNPADATPIFFYNVVTGQPGSTQTIEIKWNQTFHRSHIDTLNLSNNDLFSQASDYENEVLGRFNSTFSIERGVTSNELDAGGFFGEIVVTSGGGSETVDTLTFANVAERPTTQLEFIVVKPDSGVVLTIDGADPTAPIDGNILIPLQYQDEVSASASASGSASTSTGTLTLDGGKGEYAVLRLFGTTASTYAIVERVVQF